jgi:hypothetical protein
MEGWKRFNRSLSRLQTRVENRLRRRNLAHVELPDFRETWHRPSVPPVFGELERHRRFGFDSDVLVILAGLLRAHVSSTFQESCRAGYRVNFKLVGF